MKSSIALLLLLAAGLSGTTTSRAGENQLTNPGLEDGPEGWKPAIPPASESKNPTIDVSPGAAHSGTNGLVMSCAEPCRYSSSPTRAEGGRAQQPGERFLVSVWVRAADDFEQTPNTPGFYIRVTLHSSPGIDVPSGLLFFGLDKSAAHNPAALGATQVPKTWTKISATFEIPPETSLMNLNFFVNDGSGSVFLDDAVLEKVSGSAPLTPLAD